MSGILFLALKFIHIKFLKLIDKTNTVLVSCITPTFNRSKYLVEAIESNLKQTYSNWEMIIIDDGSTDNTKYVVEEFLKEDKRIKYFINPGKGANAARNYGISKALGKYIVFLDDDDINLPHRYESQLRAIQNSKSNFIVSGYMTKDLKSGKIIARIINDQHTKATGIGIRWMISKDLVEKVNGFDENMPSMQEVELSYRIAKHETYVNHLDIICIAGVLENSISKGENGIRGKLLLIEKHKNIMSDLEEANWNYNIATGYFLLENFQEAKKYFNNVLQLDRRFHVLIIIKFLKFIRIFPLVFQRFSMRKAQLIIKRNFPVIVEHKTVK